MKKIFLLFVCLTLSAVSFGQDKAASKATVTEISPSLSMKETAAWIKRELPVLGSYSIIKVKNDDRSKTSTENYKIESAALSDCRLSLRRTEFHGENLRLSFTETVTLSDIDVSKIRVDETPVSTGYTFNKPSYFVYLIAAADRGKPFMSQMKQEGFPTGEVKPTRWISVRVRDLEAANRVADTLRRAAILCGAPSQPVATAVAESAQKTEISPTKPAAPASSIMTNADVIQLVTAGLSEQVVTTSIRQAPTKDFDLTPAGLIALKKAGVADAVILVMQERITPVQTASTNEAKTPPKYDATLVDIPKPAAAVPALPKGCEGIEFMGLFHIEAGVGATLNIYVATIRNTGTYTKEVDVEYVKNGVNTKSTWNVGAGQKIEARLDVNNRAPTNVRITGCR